MSVEKFEIAPTPERILTGQRLIECTLSGKFLLFPDEGKIFPLCSPEDNPPFRLELQKVLQQHLIAKPLPFSAAAAKLVIPNAERKALALREAWGEDANDITADSRAVFALPGMRDLIKFSNGHLTLQNSQSPDNLPLKSAEYLVHTLSLLLLHSHLDFSPDGAVRLVQNYLHTIAETNQKLAIFPSLENHPTPPAPEIPIDLLPPSQGRRTADSGQYQTNKNEELDKSNWEMDLDFWDIANASGQQFKSICDAAEFTSEEIELLNDYFTKHTRRDSKTNKLIDRLTIAVSRLAE